MFYDETKVQLVAGKGGDGCFSMHRAKYLPKGGPDGGDGGNGGNIILEGDTNQGDLRTFHFNPIWKAKNGEPGRGSSQHGKNAPHRVLKVPLGTQVFDLETGEFLLEVMEAGSQVVLLRGGKGGRGNEYFKSPTDQSPRRTTPGEPGETGGYKFVLKTIAEVGLVGYPNAGKSTLISMLTNATPKTASYPFTTLFPHVGVMDVPEAYDRVYIADIPGLVEGASENRGLGHRFLRHIERCRVLLFMLDMQGTDDRDPVEDFKDLIREIKAYDSSLLERPRAIAANKMDEPIADENLVRLRERFGRTEKIIPLSCLSDEGMAEVKAWMYELVKQVRAVDLATQTSDAADEETEEDPLSDPK